jgi:hypothetical protein
MLTSFSVFPFFCVCVSLDKKQPTSRFNSTSTPSSPSEGGMSPLAKGVLGLAAVFGGGYAIGYYFGPLPSLEDLFKPLTGGSKASKYDGEVRFHEASFAAGVDAVLIFCKGNTYELI